MRVTCSKSQVLEQVFVGPPGLRVSLIGLAFLCG